MKTLSAVLALSLAGCAAVQPTTSYMPVIDMRPGQTLAHLSADLGACQKLAGQRMDPANAAAAGAAAGAVLGIVLGAVTGDRRLAGVGAVTTGASAAGAASLTQRQIIGRCMVMRGWAVLD